MIAITRTAVLLALWFAASACYASTVFKRIDAQDMADNVVFVGDSIVASMDVTEAYPASINFGVASTTSGWLKNKFANYAFPCTARAVVIHTGTNDITRGGSVSGFRRNMLVILGYVTVPVVVTGLHVRPKQGHATSKTAQFNAVLQEVCAMRSDCAYVPSPLLGEDGVTRPEYRIDAVHPSAQGYALWASAIADGLARVGVVP